MAKQDMSELGFSNADVLVTSPEKNNKLESPASDSKQKKQFFNLQGPYLREHWKYKEQNNKGNSEN